tara:strand:+ start:224 stop:463 length:240 start_codon:yes stop_codon:yes gene_type:complete
MKSFIVTTGEDRLILDTGDKNIIYVFENISGYEEEVFDLLDQKKMSLSQLEEIINSWGGKMRSITLRQLITNYYKNILA